MKGLDVCAMESTKCTVTFFQVIVDRRLILMAILRHAIYIPVYIIDKKALFAICDRKVQIKARFHFWPGLTHLSRIRFVIRAPITHISHIIIAIIASHHTQVSCFTSIIAFLWRNRGPTGQHRYAGRQRWGHCRRGRHIFQARTYRTDRPEDSFIQHIESELIAGIVHFIVGEKNFGLNDQP